MRTGLCAALAATVALAFASTAPAQDWMVTPAPAVPLHVTPFAPAAPPPAAPVAASAVTPTPVHLEAAPPANDPIHRLVDPYDLDGRRYTLVPAPDSRPGPLPSFWLVVPWKGSLAADRQSGFADPVIDRRAR